MQNNTPDGDDRPPLRPLPELRAMSLSDLTIWMLDELDICRRELRAEETRCAGLEKRIAEMESREREREREADGR